MKKIVKLELFIELDLDDTVPNEQIREEIQQLVNPKPAQGYVSTRDCREKFIRSHVRLTKSVLPPKEWKGE